ncbi:hypothetical protein BL250_09075 [Erwinia sp. OLTSP20]|nr:hypothetical protein BV501_10140 [Erwinia sp. OAMSP11]PIJ71959.1 hypothetical protein BK416_10785 [Erwinia sp. OLSSP12]PIJ80941.1 hypothetical protein BLD47_10265 [Erwinia sp. OLCASP19]PIJ83846.1 hypothetical protein BLD46_09190 [Erwinia sp. OLMTSP26]PIJ86004.1 hypothetical protein BLD49_09175 [Erwinia sp. OLMDSP33]PIJ92627.1 hypothetical protein BL250_09075 [Erwinia sp. OLTSP20]PIJ93495.1 hypothetical protein BL249_04460 [Erwinia sp. OLFS4]
MIINYRQFFPLTAGAKTRNALIPHRFGKFQLCYPCQRRRRAEKNALCLIYLINFLCTEFLNWQNVVTCSGPITPGNTGNEPHSAVPQSSISKGKYFWHES